MGPSGAQEFTTEVDASVQQCFATITQFEKYPDWFSSIQHTTVLDRHPDGLGRQVEFSIDMKLKTVRYVLEYAYEKPTGLTWSSVDGDVESIKGSYGFEKLGPQRSRVTCRQAISIGFWVPGPIRKVLEASALRQSVLEFKAAAEANAKRASKPRQGKK